MLLTEPTYNRTPDAALAWRARKLSQKTYLEGSTARPRVSVKEAAQSRRIFLPGLPASFRKRSGLGLPTEQPTDNGA
jgi:hypothetical protein